MVAANLVEHLLEDFDLTVTTAVLDELPETFSSGVELHARVRNGRIAVDEPHSMLVERYGPGERAAMNLALENPDWLLLIDDVRPFRAAEALGLSPVSSPAYIASLVQRGVVNREAALVRLGRLAARSTISSQLIELALGRIAEITKERGE